jgi:hypothetical protein
MTEPVTIWPPSQAEADWQALPQRLRGRGDFLRKRGRIKDAELMFCAATEIDELRRKLTKEPTCPK